MIKEELEKEAEKWLRKYLLCCNCEKKCNCIDSNSYCEGQVLKSYVAGAEPREKQIEIDAKQIRALQKQKGELTDKVAELKKQLCNLYEIIKRPYQFTAPRKIQIVEEAEQFLKEE